MAREHIVKIPESVDSFSEIMVMSIEKMPKLIRCKDCENYWKSAGMCTHAGMPVYDDITDDDFCSRAEPKKGGNE